MAKRPKTAELGPAGAKFRSGDPLNGGDLWSLAEALSAVLAEATEELPPDPTAELAKRLREVTSPFLQRRRGMRSGQAVEQPFDAEWLALREPFDARARNRNLAHRFAASLPERVTLLELGAGTGSLFRWLAPIIARPQQWLCFDEDENHLQRGVRLTASWGRRLGYTVEPGEDETSLTLHTPHGPWSMQGVGCDLEDPPVFLPLDDVDAVVCSALLDLFSEQWLTELVFSLGRVPFYAAMTVTGGGWSNHHDPDDALVREGFRRNQTGNGPRSDGLGPEAAFAAEWLARQVGLHYEWRRSDWTIGPRDRAMLRRVLAFHAGGARNALPQHRARIDAWEARRNRDVDAGRLAMRIAHRDLLISTPEKGPRHAARRRR
ncbi:MAG TPA: class I SAM-dependent methyltransferase [Acetobacteraceae bacterium]|nr:class I SAM-dependent methyltransferase [Acetobacteraceae bacterium]